MSIYGPLKSYVDREAYPSFILGVAIDGDSKLYDLTAHARGITVYGHTLAWHSQQQNTYLNSLIQDKRVELPESAGDFREVQFGTDWKDVEMTCKCNAA